MTTGKVTDMASRVGWMLLESKLWIGLNTIQ